MLDIYMCMMIIVLWFSYMDGCMSKTSCEEVYNVSMLVFPKGLILSNRFLMLKIMQNLFCLYEYISLMYLSITKWARFDLLFQGSLSEVFDRGEDSFLLIEISFNLMKINDFLLIHFFFAFLNGKFKWAFMITCCPDSVYVSVFPSVFQQFSVLLSTHASKVRTKYPWVVGIIEYCLN